MAESPFPPGTTEKIVYLDAADNVVPSREGAVRGEVTVTYPDGRVEYTSFRTGAGVDED